MKKLIDTVIIVLVIVVSMFLMFTFGINVNEIVDMFDEKETNNGIIIEMKKSA